MAEFLELLPPQIALQAYIEKLNFKVLGENVDVFESLNRTTYEDIYAPHFLPTFSRSTVDGYAVKAADTHGASESLPAYLELVGEVLMGVVPQFDIQDAECGLIHTGGMLPQGADAVVMIEETQLSRDKEVEIMRSVGQWENVIKIGEDVKKGDLIIKKGIRIRAPEIGGLLALGITKIKVSKKPKIAILSSGDEVIHPSKPLLPGQIRDINSYTLQNLVNQFGGEAITMGIIPDNALAFRDSAEKALAECDMVVFTAGSSVSVRDLTATTIDKLGRPGVLVHGVNVRPGKPTILAICDGKPVIGLPGNPVSALVIANIFVREIIRKMLGDDASQIRPKVTAQLTVNLSSQAGREDWVPVHLTNKGEAYQANPVFGKSNLIFTLVHANGLLRIPPDATGLAAGEEVQVELF